MTTTQTTLSTETKKFIAAVKRARSLAAKVARNEAEPMAAYRAVDRACELSRFVVADAPAGFDLLSAEITHAVTSELRASVTRAKDAAVDARIAARNAEIARLDASIRESRQAVDGYAHELATKGCGYGPRR